MALTVHVLLPAALHVLRDVTGWLLHCGCGHLQQHLGTKEVAATAAAKQFNPALQIEL
jgi:hypothetical protein